MSKIILTLSGGGIRGASEVEYLRLLDDSLLERGTCLREKVNLVAGTSTGGIIALALATTDLSLAEIARLYEVDTAKEIFTENEGLFEVDGVNSPKYEASGKTEVLKRYLPASLSKAAFPCLVTAYDLEKRQLFVVKSWKNRGTPAWMAADATSAAPTFFPTVPGGGRWLIDGGVTVNNPAMCGIAEAMRMWPGERLKVLSVGTGSLTRPIDGRESRDWGAVQWLKDGDLLGILMDEVAVDYYAKTILGDDYLKVNSKLNYEECRDAPPSDDMDDISAMNIALLKRLGQIWFDRFGQRAVNLILGE